MKYKWNVNRKNTLQDVMRSHQEMISAYLGFSCSYAFWRISLIIPGNQ